MNQSLPKVLVGGYQSQTVNYVSALSQIGIVPIVAFEDSISTNETFLESIDIAHYDGLVLPGGGDINPLFFGEENNGSRNIDTALDLFQLRLLKLFVYAKKPVLGICKGLQLINIFFGGNVIQDLSTSKIHAWEGEDKIHCSIAIADTFIYQLYGSTLITNSTHHQGAGRLGKDILLSQLSDDCVVEAIYHASLPIIAVQWHPERMSFDKRRTDTVDGEVLFQYFKQMLFSSRESSISFAGIHPL